MMFSACSEDIATQTEIVEEKVMPINIASTYPVAANTRATIDNGFVAGDAVGIFVVDYDSDGNPGTLALKGERAGNIRFNYDGSKWTANYQLYWKNSSTPADFYGYYPYDMNLENTIDYEFSVSRRQDSDASTTSAAGYEASDLLRAKAEKVSPTSETINLQYKHLMAGVTVILEMGSGFNESEWAGYIKKVQIENTILKGTVNLSTGVTTVSGDAKAEAITPLFYNNTWRAIVFPQTVAAGKSMASVMVDGQSYKLVKDAAITYQSGKMHKMTIRVDKNADTGKYAFTMTGDDVVAWTDDPNLHDGLVREYTVVSLSKAGTLKSEVDKICDDYDQLSSLKIVGPMNSDDRSFIQSSLLALRNVNMFGVEMEDGRLGGFSEHKRLQHFIYPQKGIHTIEGHAFFWAPLLGDLIIPEGVEVIEGEAFMDCGMKNGLSLPSTLKRIEYGAFSFNSFTGELRLPEGIEYIDPGYYYCFQGSDFEGSLHLPESLTTIPHLGFPKLTGTIIIPPGITEVSNFDGIGCTKVEFHDGVKEIKGIAFRGVPLQGELVLPPNVIKIGVGSFQSTKISHIVFNERLRIVDNGAFSDCKYLTGTQRFAENVARVPANCFENCSALTGIVFPKNVELIEDRAFYGCYSLNSIVCENPEPPVVRGDAFLGVPKDNFTVEVPKGSVEKYRNAPGWSEFKRIAEYSNFVCRPMQANALNTAHTEQLVLNADGAWEVEKKPDWVTLSKTSGTGKTELTLTFKQMAHGNGNRSDSIIFKMPTENYRTFCVVSQYDYTQEEDSYITLQEHSKGRGIDVVFIGDGYDGEDISNGNYLNLVKEQTEHFFDLEPYKSHRDYFNVYITFPLSQEKGVNTMNTYVNNHFGTLYGYDGTMCTSNQLLTEVDEVRDYAVAHSPITKDNLGRSLIILVPNSDAYSGVTYFEWYGSPISICPASSRPYPQDTRGVIQHEAGGHGFGRLGDEEIVYSAWAPSGVKSEIEDKHRDGWYANLSTTSGL
ncbi:MAG: fimbrillin family protein, partial [Prevotella sp.]|nr:fimbrillin family protein [Prevotella sp.]